MIKIWIQECANAYENTENYNFLPRCFANARAQRNKKVNNDMFIYEVLFIFLYVQLDGKNLGSINSTI